MSVQVTSDGVTVALVSPFDPAMPPRARELGGKWDAARKAWLFDPRDEERVRALAREIYGSDGADADRPGVTLRIDVAKIATRDRATRDRLTVCGHTLARRADRDSAVRLASGVVVHAGAFCSSGGSRANPALSDVDGVVLDWRDVPESVARKALAEHPQAITLADGATLDLDALRAERTALLARLAELDTLIADTDR